MIRPDKNLDNRRHMAVLERQINQYRGIIEVAHKNSLAYGFYTERLENALIEYQERQIHQEEVDKYLRGER